VRTLITGITGFVGPHLARELHRASPEDELWGLTWGSFDPEALKAAAPGVRLLEGEIADPSSIESVLAEARPEVIYHLAAASSVAHSWENAARFLEVNAMGTARLFDAAIRLDLDPVIVISSTAEIYGRVASDAAPLSETTPLAPVSPYGTSKAAQDLLAAQYNPGRGLTTVRLRFFHLTGPGRPPHFVGSSFARQIALIELGRAPAVLRVGNLDSVRDFTDVRDAVRACRMAARRRFGGEVFHVCSGRGVAISDIVDHLLELSSTKISVEIDRQRFRRADIPWLVGDPSKIASATGWSTEIPLRQTLADLLDWWRHQLAAHS
jgi:GDP-4-dehydro-6-deoxy-D-mannose reductase